MPSLADIINSPSNFEMKKALAVKMIVFDFKPEVICALLNLSNSVVSKWKIIFEHEGADALKGNYTGGTGFLTEDQRDEIIFYLRSQSHCRVEELRDYLQYHYRVVYQSKPSYYHLLTQGGLSWHHTQAVNSKRDEAPVWRKREEIKTTGAVSDRHKVG